MNLPEFKPLDLDIGLLTPPRKKPRTTDSENLSDSPKKSERGVLVSGDGDEDQSHNDSHEVVRVLTSPTGRASENEQCCNNTYIPIEDKKSETICKGSGEAHVEEIHSKGTGKVKVTKMNSPRVIEENDKIKSFQETLQEAKDLLIQAQACQEEMNSLSVKNAILMNALVMVGVDL